MSAPSAIERAAGWPARLSDADGLRVRLKRDARNAHIELKAGTSGTLEISRAGWHLLTFRADPCGHCGARGVISRMGRAAFEVLTPEES